MHYVSGSLPYQSALPFTIFPVPDLGTYHIMLMAEIAYQDESKRTGEEVFAYIQGVQMRDRILDRRPERILGQEFTVQGIFLLKPKVASVQVMVKPLNVTAKELDESHNHEVTFTATDRLIKACRWFVTEESKRLEKLIERARAHYLGEEYAKPVSY